jgi:hypothetical protein
VFSSGLDFPAESKPKSKITKTKLIGAKLMASSIIGKKSPRRGRRTEPQSTDWRPQTRRKHASRTLERLHLSSCLFLKQANIDISQNVKFLLSASSAVRASRVGAYCVDEKLLSMASSEAAEPA